jgi:tetratricopeptide (TPR) repeat protein
MQNINCNQQTIIKIISIVKNIYRSFKKVLGIKPNFTKLMLKGKSYSNLGMHKEAAKEFEHATQVNSDDPISHYHLGNTYCKLGIYDEAVKSYKKAISKKSKYADALYKLSLAYNKLGMLKEAIAITRRLINIRPNMITAYRNLGTLYSSSDMYKEAAGTLTQALKIEPENSDIRSKLASCYLELCDRDSAQEEYEKLKELSPQTAGRLSRFFNS